MADKLRQLVSVFVEFVDGERPTATKFNALSAQTRRGFEALEYAIGDLQNQSWPNSTPYLTVPYGTAWHQTDIEPDPTNAAVGYAADPSGKKKVIGASDLGRPLDIVNLARLIGPSSNLNPQVLTQGWQEISELISDPDEFASMPTPPHDSVHGMNRNQVGLKYPPIYDGISVINDITFTGDGGVLQTFVQRIHEINEPGEYHVSLTGLITSYEPIPPGVTATYKTDSLFWGGGANYLGATFNVIPDPAQIIAGGAGIGVDGPNIEGTYMLLLPPTTHAQKDWDGMGTTLSNARDYNTGKQLTLPEWMTGTDSTGQPLFQPGDVIPQGSIYLKCIDTNEIYNDAEYIYDTPSTLEIRNVDLGDNGCGLKFCLITVGTDITTSIDDLRRKQFQHSHDRRFGEPFIHITSITGQLDQGNGSSWGDRKTPIAGPYYPSKIPGDYFPQYFHRDGFRYDPHNQMGQTGADIWGSDLQSGSEAANAQAMRGSLILGRRLGATGDTIGTDVYLNTGVDANGLQRNSLNEGDHGAVVNRNGVKEPPYISDRGETFHLCFGGAPTHNHDSSGFPGGSAAGFNVRADGDSMSRLPLKAGQMYASQANELRIEAQTALYDLDSWQDIQHDVQKWWPYENPNMQLGASNSQNWRGSHFDPHGWGFGSHSALNLRLEPGEGDAPKRYLNPRGIGLYAEGGIVLENINDSINTQTPNERQRRTEGIRLLSNANVIVNACADFGVVAKDNILMNATRGDVSITAGVGTADPLQSPGRVTIGGRRLALVFSPNEIGPDDDAPFYGTGGHWNANHMVFSASLNITSGTTPHPLHGRRGNICIHATGNGGVQGRLLFSTNTSTTAMFRPHEYGGSIATADPATGGHNPAQIGDKVNIAFSTRPSGSKIGVGIWDSHTNLPPGLKRDGQPWTTNQRAPRSAMLWVKRDILNTGASSDDYIAVFEDSSDQWDPDASPDGCDNRTDRRNGIALIADTTRVGLGKSQFHWIKGLGRDSNFSSLGSIRSRHAQCDGGDGQFWVNDVVMRLDTNNSNGTTSDHDSCGDCYADDGEWQFVSGGGDYAETLLLGNPEEWQSKKEWPDLQIEGTYYRHIPEGLVIMVRDGKIYRDGLGTPMVITQRAILLGNTNEAIEIFPHAHVCFMGQVPVFVQGKARDGDLLLPGDGEGIARAVNKDDATFEQYKKAIGTVWAEPSKEKQEILETEDKAMLYLCAIGIK